MKLNERAEAIVNALHAAFCLRHRDDELFKRAVQLVQDHLTPAPTWQPIELEQLIEQAQQHVKARREAISQVGNHSWEWDGKRAWELICPPPAPRAALRQALERLEEARRAVGEYWGGDSQANRERERVVNVRTDEFTEVVRAFLETPAPTWQPTEHEQQLAELVRQTIGDGQFEPCVFYDSGLNETVLIVRDCSICESASNSDGVTVLRDNYREQNIIGLRVPGRLKGLALPAPPKEGPDHAE